eukprot:CAMPEP_0205886288 /NCGR_PEP_ID=MMETSP1083-20121108/19164_1 /ASSEMBLY_ACC=CAM_ASM_000430 /TAXON_ID=97485 /ORGANISM="Prymnesium parvum, Strain Texoma1" /LENGTH=81 /DNA_ID=CAMNT_0053249931 /DNA_START=48 /DNA_END=293 /DNA_ORIENTATION=+
MSIVINGTSFAAATRACARARRAPGSRSSRPLVITWTGDVVAAASSWGNADAAATSERQSSSANNGTRVCTRLVSPADTPR